MSAKHFHHGANGGIRVKKIFNQVSRVGLFIAGSSLILGTLFGKNVAKKFAGLASGLALLAWGC